MSNARIGAGGKVVVVVVTVVVVVDGEVVDEARAAFARGPASAADAGADSGVGAGAGVGAEAVLAGGVGGVGGLTSSAADRASRAVSLVLDAAPVAESGGCDARRSAAATGCTVDPACRGEGAELLMAKAEAATMPNRSAAATSRRPREGN